MPDEVSGVAEMCLKKHEVWMIENLVDLGDLR
jgi:hypothetical protein